MRPSAHRSLHGIVAVALVGVILSLTATSVLADAWDDVQKGEAAFSSSQYGRAIELTTRAIKSGRLKGARLAQAHVVRARSLRQAPTQRQRDRSRRDFNRAVKIVEELAQSPSVSREELGIAFYWRGLAHELMDRYPEAISDYTKSIERAGRSNAYINRARLYTQTRQYERALADYELVLKALPSNTFARRGRAELLVWQGRYDEAITAYGKAIAVGAEDRKLWFSHYGLGDAYFLKGDYARAIAAYKKSLSLRPKMSITKARLASARAALERATSPEYRSDQELWESLNLN